MKHKTKQTIFFSGLFFFGIGVGLELGNASMNSTMYFVSGIVLLLVGGLTLVNNKRIR